MRNWTNKLQGFLNLFLESKCPICQRSTPTEFCKNCDRQLKSCQVPDRQKLWHGEGELPVFAWGIYGGTLKQALAALKYDNQSQVAQPLGEWLGEAWQKSHLGAGIKLTVVPIPLYVKKQQARGYNQAELLAENFCRITRLSLKRHGLERIRDTKAQFGLSPVERQENVARAFQLGKEFRASRLNGQVLLLDDIYTTGETAKQAAQTLLHHGIRVYGIVAIATSRQSIYSDRLNL